MAAPDVILGPFNTVALTAGTAKRLKGQAGLNRHMDILNLGPGNVFLRDDLDPKVGDAASLLLPPNWAVNELAVDGTVGLGVIPDATAKISVRVR